MTEPLTIAQRLRMRALGEFSAELDRARTVEGFTVDHDKNHESGALLTAARCYLDHANGERIAGEDGDDLPPFRWPFDAAAWKPKDRRRDLIRAGALALAEIEARRPHSVVVQHARIDLDEIIAGVVCTDLEAIAEAFAAVHPAAHAALDWLDRANDGDSGDDFLDADGWEMAHHVARDLRAALATAPVI